MLSGLDALSVDELNTLESFFNVTGLDPFLEREADSLYERLLDVLEGLWYSQALKERHFDMWFAELIRKHTSEENDIQRTHGRNDTRKFELDRLRQKNAHQIDLLNVIINKILFSLLKEQQSVLNSIKFPYFEQILTVSSLASLEGPKLAAEMDIILKQKRIVTAALSLRLKSKFAAAMGMSRGGGTPASDVKRRKKTRRRLSADEAGLTDGSPGGDSPHQHAYNPHSDSRTDSRPDNRVGLGGKRARPDDYAMQGLQGSGRDPDTVVLGDPGDASLSKYGPAGRSREGPARVSRFSSASAAPAPAPVPAPAAAAAAGNGMELGVYGPGAGSSAQSIAPGLFAGPPPAASTAASPAAAATAAATAAARPVSEPPAQAPAEEQPSAKPVAVAGADPRRPPPAPAPAPTVKTEGDKSATLPLLQQLAKMLKKGAKKKAAPAPTPVPTPTPAPTAEP
jgi:hypothetical protein